MDIKAFKQLIVDILDHAHKLNAYRVSVSSRKLDVCVDVEMTYVPTGRPVCDCDDVDLDLTETGH